MTKSEAIEQMKNGVKVTHRWFSSDEFITMENGMIVTEEGYKVSQFEFWRWRTDESWNTDFSVFKKAS